ncbi:hypothetical protein N431DRAFT_534197 [Stipitochalara longipes BDJ]|nr:hypothetical protein N431DRAFT_534197 [Stipitochalara longipes BDJ]
MVHTGRPSRGCAVCRRRKIKCDEKKPECSYCIKTKQKCPEAEGKFDLAWRDQTAVARKHVEQRIRATENARSREDSFERILSPEICVRSSLSQFSIPRPVSTPRSLDDPEEFALSFFFTAYGSPTTNPLDTREHLEFLTPLYPRAGFHSTLSLSTMALASCLYNAWKSQRPDAPLSRSPYLRAVSAMKEQINQADTCANDEILLSVLLLQQYEVICHLTSIQLLVNTAKRRHPPQAHLEGALALIKHRGLHTFTNKVSQGLLFCVRAQLIDEALRNCRPLEDSLDIWGYIAPDTDVSPDIQLDNINVNMIIFNTSVAQVLKSDESNLDSRQSEIRKLLCEASEIEKRLTDWNINLPASWRPVKVSGGNCISASIQRAGLYQPYCHVYSSLPISKTWNKYRLAQIRIQFGMFNLLSRFPSLSTTANDISTCGHRIQQEADDICACIPYHIGDRNAPSVVGDKRVKYPHLPGIPTPLPHYLHATAIGGYQLFDPLTTLVSMAVPLREGQREWIGGQIMRVFRIYNIVRS